MVKIMAQHQQTLTNDQEQLSNNNNNADDGGGGGDDDLIDDNLQQQQYLESAQQTPKSPNIHQLEQDGKRTLIKNQLYLIEQLQLENANLRNERDQLQLENEELKFQLQMIRLFEVYDVNKKERVGQHQREIFLFNDLLLVTKLARRVRANITQMYTYRQSISLQGLYVELFQTTHYSFGIRLCQRSNDETIIMFNARNELDQSRFVDDLGESIAEMDEMETIKAHNIIETLHIKHQEKLKRHIMIHEDKFGIDVKFKDSDSIGESENKNPLAKDEMLKMIYNSDTRIETNYIKQINGQNEANKQQQALQQQLAQFF